ncbi:hypothetical protein PQR62_07040 [Herbaspirillum lusitanum]|uniref:Uncharacterized protein n=1 Tax=Herbaspirillum lusitanum TaxID=213312 RepID=A0ABW9A553_9BURK
MGQYGSAYRGKHIAVQDKVDARNGEVTCVVSIDGLVYPDFRGNPFRSVGAAQATGAAFARALIDAQLDGDTMEHRGYFIRTSSSEQRDGSWLGGYQLHRNDNPVPFRRATCDGFHCNSSVEAEEYAAGIAQQAIDADIAAGKL